MNVTIGYIQFEPAYADPETNRATMRSMAEQALGMDLIVFPELAVTGYELRDQAHAKSLAEPFADGATAEWARSLAASIGAAIVVGYAESDGGRAYNSCLLATPEGALHNYRKIHLFSREKELFAPGDAPPPVIETHAGRIGLMICFDWIFPETARSLALRGAQIIAHPSNLVLPYCQRAMFARCVENRVFAVTANRIGMETQAGRTLTFTGASQILDPNGETLAAAPVGVVHIGRAVIDPAHADNKRINDYNDLIGDRRPELYER